MAKYTIGLDYGTNSVRALVVNVANGREVGKAVWPYAHGDSGILLSKDPNLARQHPADYVQGAEITIKQALQSARKKVKNFSPEQVIGIGVDTTGSTPLPVDSHGNPLAFQKIFAKNLAAMAWLWKDHTGVQEAEEITEFATKHRPEYLAKCGGRYSSEWFFSKILHCLRTSPAVFEAAHTWVEIADWIPSMLTGTKARSRMTAGICAAGHKAMYSDTWGGYPDKNFLRKLDPKLADLRDRLQSRAYAIDKSVGGLTDEWAKRTDLPAGIPVAVGAFDAHLGAVGAGVGPGTLVKIMGTSACDIMVHSLRKPMEDIPGLCGIVPESVLPGYFGLEAGQSAVGDIFNWFLRLFGPDGNRLHTHETLTKEAARLILAIRNAQDSLCCVSVGNVEELLKTILTEEDILYAALDRNQPVAMQKGKHDDPIARAVLHLGGDLEDRFWETMRRLLFSGLVDRAKALLLTRAHSSLRAEEYPASIGARLAALVASVPRHVIVDPSIFPLLPMGPCMDLLRLAGGGEDEDAVMLLDAVRNMKGGRGTPARADNSNDGDSGSAEAILRSILSEISAIGLANSVTGPIDEARTTFPLGSVVVSSEEEFHDGVTRYFRHLICHCDRAIYAKPQDVAAAALDLVRRAFESSGGLHAAMGEAKAATRGGMRAILDQMTEQFRQERTGMHVQAVLAQKTSDLSWEQKVALVRHVQDSVGPQLPQDLRMRRPEELAATCELVLRRYVQVVNRWHAELPFMIDRR